MGLMKEVISGRNLRPVKRVVDDSVERAGVASWNIEKVKQLRGRFPLNEHG